MNTEPDWNKIADELKRPFDNIGWKPQVTEKKVSGQKQPIMKNGQRVAGCVAYVDARQVMDRLDEVVGWQNWSDSYRDLGRGHVECTLTIFGVSKTDAGEPSGTTNISEEKSAYSDAFKRAAVKFSVARYLYDMEMQWLPFDGWKVTLPNENNSTPKPAHSQPKKPTVAKQPVVEPEQFVVGQIVNVHGKQIKQGKIVDEKDGMYAVEVGGKTFSLSGDKLSAVKE